MVRKITANLGARKSWVRKMAMVTPKNPPMIKDGIELYKVPQISGRMPNCSLLTSQVEDVTKLRSQRSQRGPSSVEA